MSASVELRQAMDRVGGRFRRARLWGGLAVCWAGCALAGVTAAGLLARSDAATARAVAMMTVAVAAAAGLTWVLIVGRTARDPRWLARRIEAKNPDLSAALLAAVEQEPTPDGRLGFLQASTIETALAHDRTHDWGETVPKRRLTRTFLAHGLALSVLAGVVGLLGFRSVAPAGGFTPTVAAAASNIAVEVEPGNAEIERGTALLVIAKFPAAVPAEATLVVDGTAPRPMARNLDDPTFAGHVPSVDAAMSYRVEFPGGRSEAFRVTVYEHPELRRVNARLVFPEYTGLDPKAVDDVRHVSAVEGTEVTLHCQLNKGVVKAVLLDEKGKETPLAVHDAAKFVYTATIKLTDSQRYKVKLTDADGRANKLPADISIHVSRNLPPVVTVPRPGRDSRVSPLEELPLKAEVKDDFGLVRYGVSVTAPDQQTKEIVLGKPAAKPPVKKAQPDHLLDFEAIQAQPDQVVAYYFWAEDVGPDGKPRRTSGDLYFAEVRHFEEIFRQGEQQTREQQERQQQQQQQGQGGNAQQAEELAELQKQIVNAAWKLVRRETGSTPTDKFADDVKLVRESQQAVIEKAGALGEKLQTPASVEHLRQAVKLMTDVEAKFAEGTVPALQPALASAQAAYQALLKLRAREFEVTRNNQRRQQGNRSAGNNSRSPSQRQLNQLDLTDEQNRYETQSAARAQQEKQAQRDREQRENGELADRLRELARRQTDLTDRVKELQSALEQAKDEKKEELQQQLKRLREQQQQVLRDTDELQQRMEQEQNRERLADARQQVEQSRENVRQAAEALEKGQLGQAVNEGTRAGRQLDAVRDQLRKQSANQFGEEMRDLRQQARQLDDDQQKLTKQLDDMKQTPKPAAPSLRDGGEKEQVQKGLEEQKKKLDQITERVQKTVQEAEKPEPLLAQELYNTARGTAEQKLGDTMELARRLAAAGGTADAADASRKAGQGTEQLRKGIEKAAESVLGGQTDALKRAQKELDELSDQVNREVAQATGQPQPGQQQRDGQKPGERQPGQQQQQPGSDQKGQPGQQQPGQGQPGERQPGQQQPGQQGQPGERGQPGQANQPGQQERQAQPGQGQPGNQQRRSLTDPPERNDRAQQGQPGGEQRGGERTQAGGARGGPIHEDGFREWYDRMRSTEDLIDDPALRAETARIRERVRTAREEFKRHAKEPDWKNLQDLVAKPLTELRDRVAEEVRRREAPNSLVPIDRDPVPPEFADGVRRYYERLGSGR